MLSPADLGFFAYCVITLFLIIDPVANIPIFGSILTSKKGKTAKEKRRMVRQALAIAAVVLSIMTVVGKVFFEALGVNMYSFRVAGGILLFIIALEMLFGKHTKTEYSEEEHKTAKEVDDVVVTPMAVPLLTGPGAITTAIVLFDSATPIQKPLVVGAVFVAFLTSWIVIELGENLFERVGPIAVKVVVRVLGLVLAGIAVQFVFNGIGEGVRAVFA